MSILANHPILAIQLDAGVICALVALFAMLSIPFVLILCATVARARPAFRGLTIMIWLGLAGTGVLFASGFAVMAVVDHDKLEEIKRADRIDEKMVLDAVPAGGLKKISSIIMGTAGAAFCGFLCFLPGFRRMASLVMPLDPTEFHHAVALATSVGLTIACVTPLAVLHVPPLFLDNFVDKAGAPPGLAAGDEAIGLALLVAQLLYILPVAIFAAGFPLTRRFPDAMRRLGLVVPTAGQIIFALVAAVVLVVAMDQLERVIKWLWTRLELPQTDHGQFEQQLQFAMGWLGALVIGVTAGVGEEVMVRGLLQPRLGIWLSNLLFTALHAFQYNADGLLAVFIIGLACGVIRKKTNTTTSAIVHGAFDFILVMALTVQGPALQPAN